MRLLFTFIAIGLFIKPSLSQNSPMGGISFGMSYSPNDTVCAGTTIHFVTTTSSYGVSFSWGSNDTTRHFSPASTTAFSSSVTLNCVTPGTFTVYLMAFKMGPAGLKQVTIVVLPKPNVSLNISPKTVCTTPQQILLTGGSPFGGNYFGPGLNMGMLGDSVLQTGIHIYTYSYKDVNGCQASASDSIIVNICAGINELKNEKGFDFFPNPAVDEITLTLKESVEVPLKIYDVMGRVVKEIIISGKQQIVPVSELENGIYFVSIEGRQKQKFIKQ